VSRRDVIRLQLTLPIVSFLVFMFLPAGKKLFIITTLIFSILFKMYRIISSWFYAMFNKEEKPAEEMGQVERAEAEELAAAHRG